MSPLTRSRDLVGSEHGATLPITGIAPQVPGHWKHERPHRTARVSETIYKGRPRSGWGRRGSWRVRGGGGGGEPGFVFRPKKRNYGHRHAETDSGEQVTIERVYERVHGRAQSCQCSVQSKRIAPSDLSSRNGTWGPFRNPSASASDRLPPLTPPKSWASLGDNKPMYLRPADFGGPAAIWRSDRGDGDGKGSRRF